MFFRTQPLFARVSVFLHFRRQWFVFPLRSSPLRQEAMHFREWGFRCFSVGHFARHLRVTLFRTFPNFLHFVADGILYIIWLFYVFIYFRSKSQVGSTHL